MVFLFQHPGLSNTGIKGMEWAEEGHRENATNKIL